jgi:type I restriction enzyme, S subunit
MVVKPGYKQTDVGVIPEDWHTESVADLVEPTAPICYGVVQVGQHTESGVPIVAIKFVKEIARAPLHRTATSLEQPYARSRPKGGDVLISIKGTIGAVGIVPNGFKGNISRELARLRIGKNTCAEYIAHQLEASATQKRIMRSVVGTTRLEFSIATLRKFQLPLPPTDVEQRVIAETLSDADALLGTLDRLVAKKRDLKRAAMQQLLTGQTRLPGFHVEWKPKRFTDLLKYERPERFLVKSAEYLEQGASPVLTANKSFILGYTNEEFGIYQNLPAIIFDDFTTDSKYVDFPFKVKSSAIKILKARGPEVNLRFIFARMHLINFSLGEHKRYYISEYQHIELPTPDHDEQTAIAEMLIDMDAELAVLEQRREKTRALKQAMMQELLTGRTRLVSRKGAHA